MVNNNFNPTTANKSEIDDMEEIIKESDVAMTLHAPTGTDCPVVFDNLGNIPSIQLYLLMKAAIKVSYLVYKEGGYKLDEWNEIVNGLLEMLKHDMIEIAEIGEGEFKPDDPEQKSLEISDTRSEEIARALMDEKILALRFIDNLRTDFIAAELGISEQVVTDTLMYYNISRPDLRDERLSKIRADNRKYTDDKEGIS